MSRVDNHATCSVTCKVLCILADIELSCLNTTTRMKMVFARRFIPFDVYFIFSIPPLTFILQREISVKKNSLCFWWIETLILSLFWINKHTSISGNIPVALRCVTFFSQTREPTSVLLSYKRTSYHKTGNQYFSLLMFWKIRYVHWRQYSPSQYFSLQIKRCVTIYVLWSSS